MLHHVAAPAGGASNEGGRLEVHCYIMLRYAVLCYATLCYAMLRYVMLCNVMLARASCSCLHRKWLGEWPPGGTQNIIEQARSEN
jgi:hypothetical protein